MKATPARDDDFDDDVPVEVADAIRAETPELASVQAVISYLPGDRVPCPECGKTVSVTKAGTLRSHKCESVPANGSVATVIRGARSGSKRATKRQAPPSVRKWGVIGLAYSAEMTAEFYVRSATGAKSVPESVTRLPAPQAMCGPLIDGVWPQLPPAIQKQIALLADHDELIECMFQWAVYFKGLQAFAREYNSTQNPTARTREQTNVAVSASAQFGNGSGTGTFGDPRVESLSFPSS